MYKDKGGSVVSNEPTGGEVRAAGLVPTREPAGRIGITRAIKQASQHAEAA